MIDRLFCSASLALCLAAGCAAAAQEPSPGPARSIGAPANGCLAGGQALAFDGPGYSLVRTQRERYYGHADLLDYVQTLGERVTHAGLGRMLVGDLSQAKGGPLAYGHNSHQNGLDVDVWFQVAPQPLFSPLDALREPGAQPSLLNPGHNGLSPLWNGSQTTLLRLAAESPKVERIFVNPWIKRELCRSAPGDWLRKLRPWHGHDDHFHARLACPPDSPHCQAQAPVPAGDGCGEELASWFHPTKPGGAKPRTHREPWPVECGEL